jgi:hypothetical protein
VIRNEPVIAQRCERIMIGNDWERKSFIVGIVSTLDELADVVVAVVDGIAVD